MPASSVSSSATIPVRMRPVMRARRGGRDVVVDVFDRAMSYETERSSVADMGSSPVKVVVLVFTGLDRECPENSSVVFRAHCRRRQLVVAEWLGKKRPVRLSARVAAGISSAAFLSHPSRRMHRFAIPLAAVCLATAVSASSGTRVYAPTRASSPSTHTIAFASKRDGNWEIHLVTADGASRTRLTTRAEQDRFPLWSPDGTKLAFGTQGIAGWELWVMNADGSRATQLADSMVAKAHRQWSPDGTRIVFEKMRNGRRVIFVARADASALSALTDGRADDRDPMWSPDGSRIVFSSSRGGRSSIWVMRADGSAPTRLTSGAGADMSPTWSPDGSM